MKAVLCEGVNASGAVSHASVPFAAVYVTLTKREHIRLVMEANSWKVCVWPWHLELNGEPGEHLVHVEHGGRGVHSGDGVCRSSYQGSCRLFHAASGCIFDARKCA